MSFLTGRIKFMLQNDSKGFEDLSGFIINGLNLDNICYSGDTVFVVDSEEKVKETISR